MSNLYRWPSKDASYQVSIHLATAMGGSVLSFLKAEWKVSDTGSAHWASSMEICFFFQFFFLLQLKKITFFLFMFNETF
jgi:hypothetical protein